MGAHAHAQGLFDGPAPRVRTIAATAPFLDVLVDAILAAIPREDPFALADAIIFLPNRRAASGLMAAFAKRLGGAALLPAIRPLGDLDDDPDVWGPEPIALNVPPEIPPLRRRLELAQLVRRRDAAEGGVDDPVRALAWADELCRLLDGAATVGSVDWSSLSRLVEDGDLARHWRRSAQFLDIIATFWPLRLGEDGLADPATRRALLLENLAAEWRANPPQKPVIIAGSTGAVAATRTLMAAVAALPRGCVVLPGLDTDLDENVDRIDPQHPQYGLSETLEALGVARDGVAALVAEAGKARARRRLVGEALAPAHATADWRTRLEALGGNALARDGAQGLTIVEARNESEEALVIAVAMRKALETPGRTAALVTPDAALARRVTACLARWSISPQTSIGHALAETPHGVMLQLLAGLVSDEADPVALSALLQHPLVTLGFDAGTRMRLRAALGRAALRGPKAWATLDGLVARVADLAADPDARTREFAAEAAPLAEALAHALSPLQRARDAPGLASLAESLAACAELLSAGDAADKLWAGAEGEAAAGLLRDLREHGAQLGEITQAQAPRALSALMAARECAPPAGGHPRLSIWGPLEARLQRRDLMILGGLVEGVWPAMPREDPFLSRSMRRALNLPQPEARIGLAAHDFAQLACAPEVLMTRCAVREGAPAVKSRWLWRLETLARAAGAQSLFAPSAEDDPVRLARSLDAPERTIRLAPPQPRPPADARVKRISFTEVERLIRDPYAVYARRILGLERLDLPGIPTDARQRGTALHKAIERFADGDDPQRLLALIEAELEANGVDAAARRAQRPRLLESAELYVRWAAAHRAAGFIAYREVRGELALPGGRILHGRADSIDLTPDGRAEIIDYKSGAPPTTSQVKSGLSPQLTLEAAALAQGGFVDASGAKLRGMAQALIYWRFGGSDPGPAAALAGEEVMTEAKAALERLSGLLAAYADPRNLFLSKPRAQFANAWDEFDHFARRAEWADAEGGE